jgi:cilia- and flagella-associated protein 251
VAGHTAILYDIPTKKQTFLQGHCSAISCMAATSDRMVLITADSGQAALLVVWNARNGSPIFTLERPGGRGIQAMDISPDGQHLVTLSSAEGPNGEQEVIAKVHKS